ncbi:hypothetical protein Mjas_02510 [Methanothermococcus sp. Ax23]|uniref:hypothetical protein n=1 Tax=Methanothermococcus sp. Ax23 TaxID=3156486 RepID=UPI003BA2F837
MRGINPFILNLIVLTSIIALIGLVYFFMSSYIILLLTAILFISLIIYAYSVIEVMGTNKGKLVYKPKLNLSKLRYDSVMFIIFMIMFILHSKEIISMNLLIIFIILYFIYNHLGNYIIWKPPIKVYEKGIVLGDTAFYKWDELNIKDEGDKIKIKIKYYPKEVVLDKNILKGVDYERD